MELHENICWKRIFQKAKTAPDAVSEGFFYGSKAFPQVCYSQKQKTINTRLFYRTPQVAASVAF